MPFVLIEFDIRSLSFMYFLNLFFISLNSISFFFISYFHLVSFVCVFDNWRIKSSFSPFNFSMSSLKLFSSLNILFFMKLFIFVNSVILPWAISWFLNKVLYSFSDLVIFCNKEVLASINFFLSSQRFFTTVKVLFTLNKEGSNKSPSSPKPFIDKSKFISFCLIIYGVFSMSWLSSI